MTAALTLAAAFGLVVSATSFGEVMKNPATTFWGWGVGFGFLAFVGFGLWAIAS